MNSFLVLLIAGVISAVTANVCKHPKPLENFSVEKFSGYWFNAAYEVTNAEEATKYYAAKCSLFHLGYQIGQENSTNWDVVFVYEDAKQKNNLKGTYYLPDASKGFIKMYETTHNVTYDFTVMCTDYTSYFAGYACAEGANENVSEYIVLYVRDPTKFDEIVAMEELQLDKCYAGVLGKKAKEIIRHPLDNCPVH